jgi:hypothetical protein
MGREAGLMDLPIPLAFLPPRATAIAKPFECLIAAPKNYAYLQDWCDTNKPKQLRRLASSLPDSMWRKGNKR